ncbi:MAG: Two-component sensor histidine kinase [Actinomycetia bacterium]|nr:Two-component sensor histidine kinase [Actinomycetes bacterium]
MGRLRRFVPFGEGVTVTARQAGALFALAGLLGVVGAVTQPGHVALLLGIAAADLAMTGVAWTVPWHRLGRLSPLALAVPAFAILAASTWAFGGVAAGTGPFFVLLFAWVGLHYPPWAQAALAPAALVAYEVPIVLTHQPDAVVGGGVILVPICAGVGLVICQQAAFQRRARDRIRQAEQWRAALMATLAHDVRSPLTSVQMTLETLRDDRDAVPAAECDRIIGAALRQTSRILRLATGLLDVERVEALGTLRLDLTRIPLRTAVEAALAEVPGESVSTEIPVGLAVVADPQRLEQILVNLVTNALRHGRPPIVILADPDGDQVLLSVRDHGAGVPPALSGRLFDRFAGGPGNVGSVGLGLWIVRELARAHGGELRYTPAAPGAIFTVSLPLAPAAAPAPVP